MQSVSVQKRMLQENELQEKLSVTLRERNKIRRRICRSNNRLVLSLLLLNVGAKSKTIFLNRVKAHDWKLVSQMTPRHVVEDCSKRTRY